MALGKAEEWGIIERNAARLVKPPRAPREVVKAFDREQAKAFLNAVRGESLYQVALSAGLRRGEVLALHWSDIDFERGTLAVQRTLSKVAGGWELNEPKTSSSRREVRLTQFALASLRMRRAQQAEERLRVGPEWSSSELVFTTRLVVR